MTQSELDPHKQLALMRAGINMILAMISMLPEDKFGASISLILLDCQEAGEKLQKLLPMEETPGSLSPSEANKREILDQLERRDWNIAQVSRELGVTRRTLYMRLAAFGIKRKIVPRLAKPLK